MEDVKRVSIGGVSIHRERLGSGEPVALLNGVLMTTRSWVLQTAALRERYLCLLHDFRGQLLSDKPAAPWTMEDHADDLEALLDREGIDRCHLVGTSYGGEVGLIFAATRPERVRTLTVIASASEVGPELDRVVASWAEAARTDPVTLYRRSLTHNFSPAFVAANRDVIEQGEARLAACPPDFFPAFARLVDAFRKLDATELLPRIECPTLVVVGGADRLKPPRYSRLIAERVPDATLVVVPGAGHAVILERAEEVNAALLGFLERHRAGPEAAR